MKLSPPAESSTSTVGSRDRILRASLDLLASRGFGGASMKAVSSESGLPIGSLYWHFDDKATMAAAALRESVAGYFDGFPPLPEPGSRDLAWLDAYFVAGMARLYSRPVAILALARLCADESDDPVIRAARTDALAIITEHIAAAIGCVLHEADPAIDEGEIAKLAAFLASAVLGAVVTCTALASDLQAVVGTIHDALRARIGELARGRAGAWPER